MPKTANADMYVLTLPITMGQEGLALLAFLGGFSAATSMVIVATIALSIMVSNHIVVPAALRLRQLERAGTGDVKNLLVISRRVSIVLILLLGFLYFRLTKSEALAAIGLIAFTGVAQFLPAIVGGLFWRQATGRGAIAGLLIGFVIWVWCLLMPGFFTDGPVAVMIQQGPWGITWLRPHALFGLDGLDPLVHAVFWSLTANTVAYIAVSLLRDAQPLERLQGALFIDVFRQSSVIAGQQRSAATEDLYVLAQRILGSEASYKLFHEQAVRQGADSDMPVADAEFIALLERELAGSIGAATAHAMVSQVVIGDPISLQEVIRVVDETQQTISYSQQLERQSTELRETALQLQAANEQLKRLDRQKDDFLSQVSHEVRTPMTSIRSFAEILLDNHHLPIDQKTRFLKIVHSETLRLTELLDEILDLSYLESGEPKRGAEPVVADEVLAQAVDACRGLVRPDSTEILVDAGAGEARVLAIRDRLHQVFVNLVTNALKYNTSEQPRIAIRSAVDQGRYVFEIQDNGPGILRDDRDRIFEKYSRGWDQTGSRAGGTGLGLSISRSIAEMMNGRLELVDGDGTGACFRLTVPVAKQAA